MQIYDFIIAIDPDTEKSGVAIYDNNKDSLELKSLTFPQILELFGDLKEKNDFKALVIVEAGWLISKSNWHKARGRYRAERIAKNVGANHESGRKIVEMARYYNLTTIEQKPLRKSWKGRDGKITADEFKELTGYSKRTNQDERDAGLIALKYRNALI